MSAFAGFVLTHTHIHARIHIYIHTYTLYISQNEKLLLWIQINGPSSRV